ncbi:MAG: hypothetical protein ACMUIP_04565 [bacterium]
MRTRYIKALWYGIIFICFLGIYCRVFADSIKKRTIRTISPLPRVSHEPTFSPKPLSLPQPDMRISRRVPFAVAGLRTYPYNKDLEWIGIRCGDELSSRIARLSGSLVHVERLYLHEAMKAHGMRNGSVGESDHASVDKIRQMLVPTKTEAGHWIGARWLIVGSVYIQEADKEDKIMTLNTRLVNVETTEVVSSCTLQGTLEQIDYVIGNAAVSLAKAMGLSVNDACEKKLLHTENISALAQEAYDSANVDFDRGNYQDAQKDYWRSWQLSSYQFHDALIRFGECWMLLKESAKKAFETMRYNRKIAKQAVASTGLVMAQLYFAGRAPNDITYDETIEYLEDALGDGVEVVCRHSLRLVTRHKVMRLSHDVADVLKKRSRNLQWEALRVLDTLHDDTTITPLIAYIEECNDFTSAVKAASILGHFQDKEGIALQFKEMLKEQEELHDRDVALRKQIQLSIAGAYFFNTMGDEKHALLLSEKAEKLLLKWQEKAHVSLHKPSDQDRAEIYSCLGFCLYHKSVPEWDRAMKCYMRAASLGEKRPSKDQDAISPWGNIYHSIAWCAHERPDPDWNEAIKYYQMAAVQKERGLIDGSIKNGDIGFTYYNLAWCFHKKIDPDWDRAREYYQKAIKEFKEGQIDVSSTHRDLGRAYQGIAYCLHRKASPEWAEALKYYYRAVSEQETEIKEGTCIYEELSVSYHQIAWCLHNKPGAEWDDAIKWYKRSAALCAKITSDDYTKYRSLGNTSYQIAWCLHNKPGAEWDDALQWYKKAVVELEKCLAQSNAAYRSLGLAYHGIAYCLHNQSKPAWDKAIEYYTKALNVRDKVRITDAIMQDNCAAAYHGRAFCLHNKPDPEWDKAIENYTRALVEYEKEIVESSAHHENRVNTLYQIAWCFHNKPSPDWDLALEWYKKTAEAQHMFCLHNMYDCGITSYQIAWCFHNKPSPDWDTAIEWYTKSAAQIEKAYQAGEIPLLDVGQSYAIVADALCTKPIVDWENALAWYQKALDIYRRIQEEGDSSKPIMQEVQRLLHQTGCSYMLIGHPQPEKAKDSFQKALHLDPHAARTWYWCAKAYKSCGQHKEALSAAQEAVRWSHNQPLDRQKEHHNYLEELCR